MKCFLVQEVIYPIAFHGALHHIAVYQFIHMVVNGVAGKIEIIGQFLPICFAAPQIAEDIKTSLIPQNVIYIINVFCRRAAFTEHV